MGSPVIDQVLVAPQEPAPEPPTSSKQHILPLVAGNPPETCESPIKILRKNGVPIAACFYIGILLGMTDGQFGVILPSIKEYYNVSDGVVSALFMCQATGYFIAAFSNGWIVHNIKQRGALYLGGGMIIIAYVLILLGLPFPALCCCMPILGGGFALLDSGANVFPSMLPYTTTIINLIHGGMAVLNLVLVFLAFRGVQFEEHTKSEESNGLDERPPEQEKPDRQHGNFVQILKMKVTWILAMFLLFYVGVEVTIGGWGYTFLTMARYGDPVQMGRVMSGYWAGLTVGRVLLGHVTGMFGEKRMILIYLTITSGVVVLLWQTNSIGADIAGLIVLGVFLGPMFPTAIAYSNQLIPKHLYTTAVGFLVAFGQGGAAFFPFISGQIIDKAGVPNIMPYTLGLAIVMYISWLFIPTPQSTFAIFTKLKRSRPVDEERQSGLSSGS
ncbi:hypothetical protein Unana1_03885 [Umbelopsis nana]